MRYSESKLWGVENVEGAFVDSRPQLEPIQVSDSSSRFVTNCLLNRPLLPSSTTLPRLAIGSGRNVTALPGPID